MTAQPWYYLAPPRRPTRRWRSAVTMTVIVAAHNVASYLPAALASVFCQSRPADEVVVCDDGSDDDLAGAVAPYRDRVHLIRRARGGEGAAKNSAVSAANTEFVVVLDGDDEMHPRRLEALEWLAAARPDLDIITTEFEEFGPNAGAEVWSLAARFPVEDQRSAILTWNFLPAPAIRRQPLLQAGGFDEKLRYGPDWECYIRMVLRGSRAGIVAAPLYRYRRWRGQQTADVQRVLDGRIRVLEGVSALPLLDADDVILVERNLALARLERWRWRLRQGRSVREEARQLTRNRLLPSRSRALAALSAFSPAAARRIDRHRHPT
jgi:succinoglycan biosynthesis protein ExoU